MRRGSADSPKRYPTPPDRPHPPERFAAVVTQKRLAEGFGLTVAEAMWKSRPIVASRVGGIPVQITRGKLPGRAGSERISR